MNARLFDAAKEGNLKVIQILIQREHPDVDAKNGPKGETALYIATLNGHVDVVRYLLLEGKASVDLRSDGSYTSLYVAAEEGNLEMVDTLINEGNANVGAKNGPRDQSALYIASYKGHLNIIKFLIQIPKINIDQKDVFMVRLIGLIAWSG